MYSTILLYFLCVLFIIYIINKEKRKCNFTDYAMEIAESQVPRFGYRTFSTAMVTAPIVLDPQMRVRSDVF
jgi:hypothetical protein